MELFLLEEMIRLINCKNNSHMLFKKGDYDKMSKLLPEFEFGLNSQLNHQFYFEGLAPKGTQEPEIISTLGMSNSPIKDDPNYVPLFVINVFEHAYYIDYFFDKPSYLKEIWKIIN